MTPHGLLLLLFAVGPPPGGDELPDGATLRVGTRRLRHGGLVRALAFSPDGRRLASASHDRTVSAWSVPDGREVFRCAGHDADVRGVAYSPDGQLIASGGADATVRLWRASGPDAGKLLRTIPLKGDAIEALAFSPDGAALAAGGDDGTISLIDPRKLAVVRTMTQERGITALAWSADGSLLASNGAGQAVTIWRPARGTALRSFGDEPAVCLAFAPKGTRLVTWEEGSALRVWDADTGKQVTSWVAGDDPGRGGAGSQIYQVAFSRDGQRVLCGTLGGAVETYDAASGKRTARWPGHAGRAAAVAVAPRGGLAASGGGDHAVRLWDVKTGREVSPPVEIGPVASLAVLPGREPTVAVVQAGGAAGLWALKGGKAERLAPPRAAAVQAAFRPDGVLFLAGEDRLRTYALSSKKLTERPRPASPLAGLALSSDGERLATTHRDGRVSVADSDGTKEAVSPNRERPIVPVMSHAGGLVAGIGPMAFVPLWDGATAEPLPPLGGHRGGALAAAFSPDDRALLTAGRDRRAQVWDVWTGQPRRAALEHPAWVSAVAWAPSGEVAATADVMGTIRFWSLGTGRVIAERRGHRGPVTALAFADGGRALISGGQDASVLVWRVPAVKPAPAAALTEARRKELWEVLRGGDAAAAVAAVRALAGDPARSVALVRGGVKPPDTTGLDKLIAQIDHEKFEVRDKAVKELAQLGAHARDALRQALAKKPSLEKVKTIEGLLRAIGDGRPSGERLRALRAIELLERIGSKDGRAALQELAKSRNAEVAREAKAALRRLGG